MPLNLRAHYSGGLAVFLCSGGGDTQFAGGFEVEVLIWEVGSGNGNFRGHGGQMKLC